MSRCSPFTAMGSGILQRVQAVVNALVQLSVWALIAIATPVRAQDIEPRSYSNAPIGVNFLIAGYAYTRGGIAFGPALPLTNEELKTSSAILAYARVFDFMGMSGKFDAIVPYASLSGSADFAGEQVTRDVTGFADARLRVSVNFYGAPALKLSEFKDYEQDWIVGASLQVAFPSGQYDSTRLINIGTNRWFIKPEIGISKAVGPLTLEGAFAVTFYTDNNDFFGGKQRSQDPLYSVRAHAIYNFPSGLWGSFDVTYFTGGRTTVNGVLDYNLQQNWRVGGTLAIPIDQRNSIKLNVSSGVSARTGNNFDLAGIAWQYRWGGGL